MKKEQKLYKVLCDDMTNIALLGAPKIKYRSGAWNLPLEPLSDDPFRGGGHRCLPGDIILYESNYRVKTNGVYFEASDRILRMTIQYGAAIP